jgi:hypothetical protein
MTVVERYSDIQKISFNFRDVLFSDLLIPVDNGNLFAFLSYKSCMLVMLNELLGLEI